LPLQLLADVRIHDGNDHHKQNHGNGTGPAGIGELEHFLKHAVGNNLCSVVTVGHDIDDVKDLEHIHQHGGGNHGQGGPHFRDDDVPEDLPVIGTIHLPRLHQFLGDAFVGGG